jgi:hypothetical protein
LDAWNYRAGPGCSCGKLSKMDLDTTFDAIRTASIITANQR